MTAFDPAPERMSDLITPAWLNVALAGEDGIREVVGARLVDDYTTVASKVRFAADVVTDAGQPETRAYCVKGGFSDSSSQRIVDLTIEARFYQEVGAGLDVRMPRCLYAGYDPEHGRCVFIMNDLVAEGVTFLNSQSPYTVELAGSSLDQLAILHAATWGAERQQNLAWLTDSGPSPATMPAEYVQKNVNDGRADGLPDSLRDAERIIEAMRRVKAAPKLCLAHGDPHSLNIYLDRDGRPCLMDWQLIHLGHWATDVAYHLSCALPTEIRRANEEPLLRRYLETLAGLDIAVPSYDDALDWYGKQLAYGYFLWCLAAATPRVDIVEHIPRIGRAMLDHGTFERLGM